MKRILIGVAAALILGAILFASIRSGGKKGEKVFAEPAATRTIQVVVTAPGQVDPKVKVNISAHVIGKIERLYFKEGDMVKRGQRLVDLERQSFVAQRDSSTAELANRRIEVQRAKAALTAAEMNFNRAKQLEQQGIQAQEAFDRARLEYSNARAAYDSSRAGVRQSQAILAQTSNDLSRTTLHAPIDGKVVQLNAHEGEVVITGTMNNPGSVIAVLADLSEILVEAEVGETEVVAISVGQDATIKVDAISGKEYRGRVVEIGSSAAIRQNAGSGIRYFKVKVAFAAPDDRLRPGMTSQVSIVTTTAASTLALPIQCVVERVPGAKKGAGDDEDSDKAKRKYVFLVRERKADMVEVTTGISDATHVAIVNGIKAGDVVVTGPFRTLKKLFDGDALEVTKEDQVGNSKKAGKASK